MTEDEADPSELGPFTAAEDRLLKTIGLTRADITDDRAYPSPGAWLTSWFPGGGDAYTNSHKQQEHRVRTKMPTNEIIVEAAASWRLANAQAAAALDELVATITREIEDGRSNKAAAARDCAVATTTIDRWMK